MSGRHPELSVEVLHTNFDAQVEVLRDGRFDVGFLRLPVDLRGLRHEPLLTEPRVVALPTEHRLVGKHSVHLADLADERLLQNPAAVPEWRTVAPDPTGVPTIRTVEEKLENVAAGRGILVLPLSTATLLHPPRHRPRTHRRHLPKPGPPGRSPP